MQLHFADDFDASNYLLFEVAEEKLDQILNGQISFEVVSNEKDPVVVCTKGETYDLLEFDTSNTLLIHDGKNIISKANSVFELRDWIPPFLGFKRLMSQNYLTEQEILDEKLENAMTYDHLLNNTLCSRDEFEDMLIKLSVININGYLKILAPEVRNKIIDQIYRYSQLSDNWREVNKNDLLNNIDLSHLSKNLSVEEARNRPILVNILFSVLHSLASDIKEEYVILDDIKIAQYLASTFLLKARFGNMTLEEFENELKGILPHDIPYSLDLFYGIIYLENDNVQYIDEDLLPTAIRERFIILFERKRKWTQSEIEPLFKYFETRLLKFNDFAPRYARFADGLWMPK